MPITRDIYGESGLDIVLGVKVNRKRFPGYYTDNKDKEIYDFFLP